MRPHTESLLFRAIVLATLIVSAVLFATRQPVDNNLAKVEQPSADYQSHNEHAEKAVFGIGAEGWTAIFTGVLAVFTMGLAGVTYALIIVTKRGITEQAELTRASIEQTGRSADAALKVAIATEQQAFAAIAAQLPVLRFDAPELHTVDDMVRHSGPYASSEVYGLPKKISIIPRLPIRNEGKSDASIQTIFMSWLIIGPTPVNMTGSSIYSPTSIEAGFSALIDTGPFHIILNDMQIAKIEDNTHKLNFCLSIDYADFTGCIWKETVTWVWQQGSDAGIYTFMRNYEAPENYNKKQKVWDANMRDNNQPRYNPRPI